MDLSRQDSSRARTARPTQQEIEVRKAQKRIDDYIAGGSRPVLISRGIIGGFLVVMWVVLWWQGL